MHYRPQPTATTTQTATAHFDNLRASTKALYVQDILDRSIRETIGFSRNEGVSTTSLQLYQVPASGKFLMAIPYSPATLMSDPFDDAALPVNSDIYLLPMPSTDQHRPVRRLLTCSESSKHYMVRHPYNSRGDGMRRYRQQSGATVDYDII